MKFLPSFLCGLLAVLFLLPAAPRTAEAAAAPPLTRARILSVWSDQTSERFVSQAKPYRVGKTFAGNTLYLKVKYTGYPDWKLVFLKNYDYHIRYREVSLKSIGNPATGFEQILAVPFAELGGSAELTLTARTRNYNQNGPQEQIVRATGITLENG